MFIFCHQRQKTAIGFAKATQMQAFALTKRTPHKVERVSRTKMQRSRNFARFNILSALMDPPHL